MGAWVTSLAGTPEGARLALILALVAALMHAVFGALQKGRHDPWLSRGAIDFSYGIIAMPIALFVVPWPEPHMWVIFLGMFLIHLLYKIVQGMAYTYGAYTVVYPVVRGLGPLVTVLFAGVVFGEYFKPLQWGGVALLTGAIFALALANLARVDMEQSRLRVALLWAAGGGVMVAAYTTYDAYGIRAAQDPFTFLAWFFFIDGLSVFPWVALWRIRRQRQPTEIRPLMRRGLIGGLVAYVSFGAIMLATRLDNVGEAAVLRETSPIFAALIGWIFLQERVGAFRALLMALIAVGAVLTEIGG